MTKLRWVLVVAGVLALIVAIGALTFFFVIPEEDTTAPHLKNFTAEEQHRKAQQIVDGLNTHGVAGVPISRGGGHGDPEELAEAADQDETVKSVMPGADCQYILLSVDDEGEQEAQIVPGVHKESRIYLLNLDVDESCPGNSQRSRTLGLYFIPIWGYWTALSFAN